MKYLPILGSIRAWNLPTQTKSSEEGGGLGALTTLARAVEQENRREELCVKLAEEMKYLDVLKAEVT